MRSLRAWSARASGRIRASRANVPPSPRLSARSTTETYLNDTMKLMDQKISERTPITFSGVSGMRWWPLKHSLIAYSGLVPMSP
jgi:hypothetical protein